MRNELAALFVVTLVAVPAAAQSTGGSDRPWWEDNLQVRKTFDGGKGESEPAAVGFVAPGKDSTTYWLVDAGVRLTPQQVQLSRSAPVELFWSPSIEWHHMNAEPINRQDARNKLSPAFNAELWFGKGQSKNLRAYVIGKAAITRDILNDTTENSYTVLVGLFQALAVEPEGKGWEGGFRPGAELGYNGFRRLHYFPYVGFEHYRKLAIANKTTTLAPSFNGSLLLLRLQADTYPFHHEDLPGNIPFSISVEYTYRRALDEITDVNTRNLNLLSLGGTWFFVSNQRAGIGLTFDVGSAPATNFVSQRRAVLALRLKY